MSDGVESVMDLIAAYGLEVEASCPGGSLDTNGECAPEDSLFSYGGMNVSAEENQVAEVDSVQQTLERVQDQVRELERENRRLLTTIVDNDTERRVHEQWLKEYREKSGLEDDQMKLVEGKLGVERQLTAALQRQNDDLDQRLTFHMNETAKLRIENDDLTRRLRAYMDEAHEEHAAAKKLMTLRCF